MDCLETLKSVRAPDASRDFTLSLDRDGLVELASVAGRNAVTLDLVTGIAEGILFRGGFRTPRRESLDEIFYRFPRLKSVQVVFEDLKDCTMIISSFLDNYQVNYEIELIIIRAAARKGGGETLS